MAGEKYWKISRVVMVIMSEYIGFVTSGHKVTSDKSNIFTIYGKIISIITQVAKSLSKYLSLFPLVIITWSFNTNL